MDLFNHKLTMQEALHYNSILDSGGLDADVLAVYTLGNAPMWRPGMPDPELELTKNSQIANKIAKQRDESRQIQQVSIQNKNPVRTYIKLPNAAILKHKHQYRGSQTQRHNE